MAASVAPEQYLPASETPSLVVIPAAEPDNLATANSTFLSQYSGPHLDDIFSTPIYRRLHKVAVTIGLILGVRVVILSFLFCTWSVKCMIEYPIGYEPGYLFFQELDLEGLLIPVELRNEMSIRYIFASVFPIDTLVCVVTAVVSSYINNIPWMIHLCILWFCFMLLTLAVYVVAALLFFYHKKYITLYYLHLVLLPIVMTLLAFNIQCLRNLFKMGYISFPKPNKSEIKMQKQNRDNQQEYKVPESEMEMNNTMSTDSMYNNIFGTPGLDSGPKPSSSPRASLRPVRPSLSTSPSVNPLLSPGSFPSSDPYQTPSFTSQNSYGYEPYTQSYERGPNDTSMYPYSTAPSSYPNPDYGSSNNSYQAPQGSGPPTYSPYDPYSYNSTPPPYYSSQGSAPQPPSYNPYNYSAYQQQQPTSSYNSSSNQPNQPSGYTANSNPTNYNSNNSNMAKRLSRLLSTQTATTTTSASLVSKPQATRQESKELKERKEEKESKELKERKEEKKTNKTKKKKKSKKKHKHKRSKNR